MEDYFQLKNSCTLSKNNPASLQKQIDQFNAYLSTYDAISLGEMDGVALMHRVDTKFLINTEQLSELLLKAKDFYHVVQIQGERLTPYKTIYFDTDNAEMYNMHHNGKLNRVKIRTRSYVNSGISFLEIKKKNNKGKTTKNRILIENRLFESMIFKGNESEFVSSITPYLASGLAPQLQNFFYRITLVDKCMTERVTIDFGIQFTKVSNGICEDVDGLVVVEMKQDGVCCSHFRKFLYQMKVLPCSMSKYCLGMVLVNPEIKNNRFKNKIRKITKITNNHVKL